MTVKAPLALASLALLSGCMTHINQPIVEGTAAPAGTAVPLRQPVEAGTLVATPMEVIEDSRCPQGTQCVWAGRLIVSTRIDGAGWRETVPLTLGQAHATHGAIVKLAAAYPARQAERKTPPGEYRFVYTDSD